MSVAPLDNSEDDDQKPFENMFRPSPISKKKNKFEK